MIQLRTTLLAPLALSASLASADGEPIDFNRDIRPILSDNCFHCHGPDAGARQADLRLDVKEGLFRAEDDVAVIVPGRSGESELVRRITSTEEFERMPPPDSNRELTAEQIELLRRWIDQGAEWQQHWAFVPPRRPGLPAVSDAGWPHNAIDHFVLARLEREGLRPSPEADKETLVRRVTLDLTGLPPTPEEIDAFLADDSPQAYETLVDRLLASERYGERMVWEWLDAARYADSNGYQADPERTMWPWRDWVVRALNDNMPFDRFTIEQLAGDLLPEATLDQRIATGFNRNHMYNGEGGRIPEETRAENVMDRAETTATVWLGLTLTCCRCHDHKYDPLSAREYYGLYAFFNNTSEEGARYGSGQVPPVVDYLSESDRARRDELAQQARSLAAEVAALEGGLFPREEGKRAAESEAAAGLAENIIALLRQSPEQRNANGLGELAKHFEAEQPEYAQRLAALKQAVEQRDHFARNVPQVMVMDERPQPRETHVLVGGLYNKPGEPVTADVPAVLPPLPEGEPKNRLTLARWLVSPDHPLTARVTVNRSWQTFFGQGLVRTSEDFGVQGEKPSHPELLDWLATEFVTSGWDVKHMHRLIVTSATYRQSSKVGQAFQPDADTGDGPDSGSERGVPPRQAFQPDADTGDGPDSGSERGVPQRQAGKPDLLERDPENRLLARSQRLRLPSWMLRDQALYTGGLLVEKSGGPPVRPYQPEGIWAEATFGQKRYVQDTGEGLYRRSLYTFWRRIVAPTMFFDVANRQVCTVKTTRTNTPLHALLTLNDITYVEAARALAQRLLAEEGLTPAGRIESAFRRTTARRPRPEELDILLSRLDRLHAEFASDPEAAARLLKVGESPRDESLDPIEHAAWTALCSLILNLDESLTRQ